jgi:hypothetical protein
MATLLLNLRDVPDDEADEVRALLDAHAIEWYETKPSLWGVSGGGLWTARDDQAERAQAQLAAYHAQRAERAQAQRAEDLRAGRVESSWHGWRRRPLQALVAAVGILLMLAVTLLPFVLLR